jgi:hypothetical protein
MSGDNVLCGVYGTAHAMNRDDTSDAVHHESGQCLPTISLSLLGFDIERWPNDAASLSGHSDDLSGI